MYEKIRETASWIKERMTTNPTTAIILGTGLGQLASEITDKYEFPYSEIPNFPISTVEGHSGKLIFGKLGNKDIMAMQGRFHYYEGYTMQQVTFPIRVMKLLGISYLFVSNAAGGINLNYSIGDLMIIKDHINLLPNPLIGPNLDEFGPRFPDMTRPYDPSLRKLARETAASMGLKLQEGVYIGCTGPCYETPAEYKFFRTIGSDVVGMSTGREILLA